MSTINVTYGYFYAYTYYLYDTTFLCLACIFLFAIAMEMAMNLFYFSKHFMNDLSKIHTSVAARIWSKDNLLILCILSILCNSIYHSIAFANSHLFGIKFFSMNLTNIQLKSFQNVHRLQLLFLSSIKFLIHLVSVICVFEKEYDELHTIKAFTIIAAACNIMTLAAKIASAKSKIVSYKITKFQIIIIQVWINIF